MPFGYFELGLWGSDDATPYYSGDGACDWKNNNLFGNWDGGDCCCETCVDPDGAPGMCAVIGGCSEGFGDCVGPVAMLGASPHHDLNNMCDDLNSECSEWASKGYCGLSETLRSSCPDSCGTCDVAPPCLDVLDYNCGSLTNSSVSSSEWCSDASIEMLYCPLTCGYCNATISTCADSAAYNCTDLDGDLCAAYFCPTCWYADVCDGSCGYCGDDDTSGGDGDDNNDDDDDDEDDDEDESWSYKDDTTEWSYCAKFGPSLAISAACGLNELTSDASVIKYPFTAWQGVRDIIKHYEGEEAFTMGRIPSVVCPDCWTYNGSYFSVNFAVDQEVTLYGSTNVSSAQAFPGLESARTRFLGRNLVLVGPLLTQWRFDARATCDRAASYFTTHLSNTGFLCHRSNAEKQTSWTSQESIGTDPTLDTTSSLYRATNRDTSHLCLVYPKFCESNYSAVLAGSATESLTTAGLSYPPAFTYDESSGGNPSKIPFPVLFDVNFNHTKAAQIVTLIDDGNYIDALTSKLKLNIITYNPDAGLWGNTELQWRPLVGGNWKFQQATSVVDLTRYFSPEEKIRAVFELILMALLAWFIFNEFDEMRTARQNHGSVRVYFQSAENWIDLAVYSLLLAAVIVWCHTYFGPTVRRVTPILSLDVYQDFFATLGLVRMNDAEQAVLQDFFSDFQGLVMALELYKTLTSVALLLMVVQLIAKLNFHPRLGVISRTIAAAAHELGFFFVLFLFVTMLFTVLGFALFGQQFDDFGGIAVAFEQCLYIMVGEFGSYATTPDVPGNRVVARLWFWMYVMVVLFILLNVLLAVLIAGYDEVVHSAEDPTWRDPALKFMHIQRFRFQASAEERAMYMSDQLLKEAIDAVIAAFGADHSQLTGARASVKAAERRSWGLGRSSSRHFLGAKDVLVTLGRDYALFADAEVSQANASISGYVMSVFGARVDEHQLMELLVKMGCPLGLHIVIVLNILMRIGVPAGEVDDEKLERMNNDADTRRMRTQVRAFALFPQR